MSGHNERSIALQNAAETPLLTVAVSVLEKKEHRDMVADAVRIDPDHAPYLAALLAMKEQDGKENALLYYAQAGFLAPKGEDKRNTLTTLTNRVQDKGWDSNAEALKPYLESWQPALKLVKKGAAVGYAKGLGTNREFWGPDPDPIFPIYAGRALAIEGLYLESVGRYEEALEDYLTRFSMGADYLEPGNDADTLVGLGGRTIGSSLRRIRGIAGSGNLSSKSLCLIMSSLSIKKDLLALLDEAMETDARVWMAAARTAKSNLEKGTGFEEKVTLTDVISDCSRQAIRGYLVYQFRRRRFASHMENIEPDMKALLALEKKFMRASWWTSDFEGYRKEKALLLEKAHPVVQELFKKGYMVCVRQADSDISKKYGCTWNESMLRGTRISIALTLYRMEKGKLPKSLDELQKDYFPSGIPTDPFSGKAFIYERDAARSLGYRLASVGPDAVFDESKTVYDSLNGITSAGDIEIGP